jgi:hypothetical protein
MKRLLAATLLFAAGSIGVVQAQTVFTPRPTIIRSPAPPTISAELNDYEIRRCVLLGYLSEGEAKEIRKRKKLTGHEDPEANLTEQMYLEEQALRDFPGPKPAAGGATATGPALKK